MKKSLFIVIVITCLYSCVNNTPKVSPKKLAIAMMNDSTITSAFGGIKLGSAKDSVLHLAVQISDTKYIKGDFSEGDYRKAFYMGTDVFLQNDIYIFDTNLSFICDSTYCKIGVKCFLDFYNDYLYSILIYPEHHSVDKYWDAIKKLYIDKYGIGYITENSPLYKYNDFTIWPLGEITFYKGCQAEMETWKANNMEISLVKHKTYQEKFTYSERSFELAYDKTIEYEQLYKKCGMKYTEAMRAKYLTEEATLIDIEKFHDTNFFIIYKDKSIHQEILNFLQMLREKSDSLKYSKIQLEQLLNKENFSKQII